MTCLPVRTRRRFHKPITYLRKYAAETREEKEIQDLARDAKTVFVGQLVVRINEADIREYFNMVRL